MAHVLKLRQFSTPAALNGMNLLASEKRNLLLLLSLELLFSPLLYTVKEWSRNLLERVRISVL